MELVLALLLAIGLILAATRLGLRRMGERRASDAWNTAFIVAALSGVALGVFCMISIAVVREV